MDFHSWIEIAGLVGTVFGIFGTLFAFWQYRVFKRKGEWLRHFLLGLKACDLPTKAEKQVNDMLLTRKLLLGVLLAVIVDFALYCLVSLL